VIDDRARGSFTGRIVVRPDTVDTSAHQTNHALLLSPTAQSDSRPWLEILADDVRCTHGAAAGRLDEDAVFYLRSRGIPERTARDLLIDAFIAEIADAMQPLSLRQHLESVVSARRRRPEVPG
jgi:Fe-S cluster assembly protein SufD